jgi:hypothetical protein
MSLCELFKGYAIDVIAWRAPGDQPIVTTTLLVCCHFRDECVEGFTRFPGPPITANAQTNAHMRLLLLEECYLFGWQL